MNSWDNKRNGATIFIEIMPFRIFFLLQYIQCAKYSGGFPSGSAVKNLSSVQETQVRSLSQEDPLEEDMGTLSSVLAWRTPWTEEPRGLQSVGSQRVRRD